ncbi:MAG: hypothetical protein IPL05_20850 [Betaproteobacteria bacterium]|nr:hypothetical protein [Betaproteobacteria bacterium]
MPAAKATSSITGRWNEIGDLRLSQVAALMGSAHDPPTRFTLDRHPENLRRARRDNALTNTTPNRRQLIAQSVAMCSSSVGGVPGAGTVGATQVNLSSGATTRASGWSKASRHWSSHYC